jgi:hypothetical protein
MKSDRSELETKGSIRLFDARLQRPKLACSCCRCIGQAITPSRTIDCELPGPALLPHIVTSKFALCWLVKRGEWVNYEKRRQEIGARVLQLLRYRFALALTTRSLGLALLIIFSAIKTLTRVRYSQPRNKRNEFFLTILTI